MLGCGREVEKGVEKGAGETLQGLTWQPGSGLSGAIKRGLG